MISLVFGFAAVLLALSIGERVYTVRKARKETAAMREASIRHLEMNVYDESAEQLEDRAALARDRLAQIDRWAVERSRQS